MKRDDCLRAASDAVSRRPRQYGPPEQNFERIAALWRAHLSNKYGRACHLDNSDVALMMVLLKVARLEADDTHADSWIDIAGYAATGAEVAVALVDDDDEELFEVDVEAARRVTHINHHGEELV